MGILELIGIICGCISFCAILFGFIWLFVMSGGEDWKAHLDNPPKPPPKRRLNLWYDGDNFKAI